MGTGLRAGGKKTIGESNSLHSSISQREDVIPFRRPCVDDVKKIHEILTRYKMSRACDWTVGGIFMWIDYFDYKIFIKDNTLFIRGHAEDNTHRQAFSVPIGEMPLEESLGLIKRHCKATGEEMFFSAVPEDVVGVLRRFNVKEESELEGWSDYIYDVEALATLKGKKYNKKRNHVNQFKKSHPDFSVEPLSQNNARAAQEFLKGLRVEEEDEMAYFDKEEVMNVVENIEKFPMWEGMVLSTPEEGVVALTVGEVSGDVLVIHIEKMLHEVAGAGEIINQSYAAYMKARHPELKWINREEDLNKEGLRKSKISYHPAFLLKKYNVGLNL